MHKKNFDDNSKLFIALIRYFYDNVTTDIHYTEPFISNIIL
jgi:hypothetical protein